MYNKVQHEAYENNMYMQITLYVYIYSWINI